MKIQLYESPSVSIAFDADCSNTASSAISSSSNADISAMWRFGTIHCWYAIHDAAGASQVNEEVSRMTCASSVQSGQRLALANASPSRATRGGTNGNGMTCE